MLNTWVGSCQLRWAVALAVTALWLAGAGQATLLAKAPAPEESLLPAGLDLVPPDGPGFFTADVAALWKNEKVKELLKKLDKQQGNWKAEFKKSVGLDPEQIERATVILSMPVQEEPTVVVTTAKPFDKAAVSAAIVPGAQEKKTNSGKVYFQRDGRTVLHFVSDRVFLVGRDKSALALVERGPRPKAEGPLRDTLEAAAKQPLAIGLNLALFANEIKKDLPDEAKPILPLFAANHALLTAISNQDTSANLHLTFAQEAAAKEGEAAAKEGLSLLRQLVAKGKEEIAREAKNAPPDEMTKWLMEQAQLALGQIDEGLKAGTVRRQGKDLHVSVTVKIDAGTMATFAAGTVFSGFSSKAAPPPPPEIRPLPPEIKPLPPEKLRRP